MFIWKKRDLKLSKHFKSNDNDGTNPQNGTSSLSQAAFVIIGTRATTAGTLIKEVSDCVWLQQIVPWAAVNALEEPRDLLQFKQAEIYGLKQWSFTSPLHHPLQSRWSFPVNLWDVQRREDPSVARFVDRIQQSHRHLSCRWTQLLSLCVCVSLWNSTSCTYQMTSGMWNSTRFQLKP